MSRPEPSAAITALHQHALIERGYSAGSPAEPALPEHIAPGDVWLTPHRAAFAAAPEES